MISWQRLATPALLLMAPVIFFADVCLRGRAFLLRDLFSWFFPWRDMARQALAAGELPLWNPWSYMGTPFLANMQSGLLYPLNVVFWIASFPTAMRLFVVMQFALTALLMHALLRALGCRSAAALTGALGYAFSGWMLVHLEFPNKLSAAGWLPLLALGIVLWARGARVPGLALGAVAVAMSLAAGYPQTTETVVLGAAVIWACHLCTQARAGARRALAEAASLPAMTLLGCLVAAAQLVPFAEAAFLSERAGARDAAQVLQRSLEPGHLMGLLLPHLFGVPGYQRYWGGDLLQFWLGHFYVGLPVIVLGLLAPLALRRWGSPGGEGDPPPEGARAGGFSRREAIVAGLVLLAVSVVLCLGDATPLPPLLVRVVPGLAYFRWFSTTSLLLTFALCWVAPLVLETLLARADGDPEARRRLALGACALALPVAGLALISVATPTIFLSCVRWLVSGVMRADQEPALAQNIVLVRRDALRAAMLAAGLAATLVAAWRGRIGWRRAAWIFPLVLFLDLMGGASGVIATGDPALYTQPPATLAQVRAKVPPLSRIYVTRDTLEKDLFLYGEQQEGFFRWASEIFLFNLNLPYGLFSASDGDPVRPLRTARWHRVVEESDDRDRSRRLLAAAGVSHILMGSPGEPTEMVEVPGTLPRAWVASGAVRLTPEEAFQRLGSPAWDPAREVMVERDAPDVLRPPGAAIAHSVHAVEYTRNAVRVDVESSAPGYLVLDDTMYPGWKGAVDGSPVPVFTANYLFRALELPAGRHTVIFSYRPASVAWGAAGSAVGMVLLGALAVRAARATRRSVPTPRRRGGRGTAPAPPRTTPIP